ncbi:glycosyltransferase family 9 protein [Hufsiella ginkgonis]|uniref:Glycosyltransferase family 9 protein n=1 Tax=Hufsiella ginkgonis TaxID=2695274 RepID=A0A7K1Y2D4_9SPHI|nr:glycosyltransferase family 9 protein [Hufsiella ginkgonis]MXV17444.1 glycosyltransferase family 9 protein [Hufsiella ginkgonis]
MPPARKRILVYRIGSLGDTIIALPAFNKVCEMFPDADITLLTNRPIVSKAAAVESVLGQGYFFHRVVNYPSGTRNPLVLLALWKELRALKIDIAINLATTRILKDLATTKRTVLRDKWFLWSTGIRQFLGFPAIRQDFELSIDPVTGQYEWEALRVMRRLESLGPADLTSDRYWDLHFSEEELGQAKQALQPLAPGQPIVAMCAGTKMQSKDWEEQNWLSFTSRLKTLLPGWQLVMVGAPDEAARADKCIETWGGGVNLCGKTSPRVSGAVLKQARVFVGHDSGPMHLAAATGTPVVAIYSARNLPRQWFPRGDGNRIIYHKTDCAGCVLEVCVAEKKKCILSVTVDEVIDAVMEVLLRREAGSQQ